MRLSGASAADRGGVRGLDRLVEVAPIEQPGQRIAHGGLGDPGMEVGVLQRDRDLGRRAGRRCRSSSSVNVRSAPTRVTPRTRSTSPSTMIGTAMPAWGVVTAWTHRPAVGRPHVDRLVPTTRDASRCTGRPAGVPGHDLDPDGRRREADARARRGRRHRRVATRARRRRPRAARRRHRRPRRRSAVDRGRRPGSRLTASTRSMAWSRVAPLVVEPGRAEGAGQGVDDHLGEGHVRPGRSAARRSPRSSRRRGARRRGRPGAATSLRTSGRAAR